MHDVDERLAALQNSRFRARFALAAADHRYLAARSAATLHRHAYDIVQQRLAPAQPERDGQQTPMKGHPVFIAQHATATCCRNCLAKWHDIARGRPLTESEVEYVVDVIEHWLARQKANAPETNDPQRRLFPLEGDGEVKIGDEP